MKRLALLSLCCLLGQQVCLADSISGRLFFTPAERAALDRARAQNIAIQNRQGNPNTSDLTLNGVIQRSDGKETFWVNGRPIDNGADAADPRLLPGRQGHKLEMPLTHDAYRLKVGQSINPATGQVTESYSTRPQPGGDSPPASAVKAPPQP